MRYDGLSKVDKLETELLGDAGRLDGVSLLPQGRGQARQARQVPPLAESGTAGRRLSWEFYRGTRLRWFEVLIGIVILIVILAGFVWGFRAGI